MTNLRWWLASLATLCTATALAAVPVEIEVGAVDGAPFEQLQKWSTVLGTMDLARVTLRGARDGETPTIESDPDAVAPRFKVFALLSRDNRLLLPGGQFGLGDAERLKQHLHAIPDAMDEATIERGRFGLTKEDFKTLFDSLSQTAEGASADADMGNWVRATIADLPAPCKWTRDARQGVVDAGEFGADWSQFSRGTVLAAALRQAGLVLVPQQVRRDPLRLAIEPLTPDTKWDAAWPVGWRPEGTAKQVVPAMFKVTTVEIANYTLSQTLAAMERPLGAAIRLDRFGLMMAQVEPAKVRIAIPRKKLLVKNAVDKALSQARLAGELRVDEAGRPFYWVTRFGPTSPRAVK